MSEPKIAYTTDVSLLDQLLSVLESWQWARILFHIASIVRGTGYGEIKIVIRNGEISDLSSMMTEKPRRPIN